MCVRSFMIRWRPVLLCAVARWPVPAGRVYPRQHPQPRLLGSQLSFFIQDGLDGAVARSCLVADVVSWRQRWLWCHIGCYSVIRHIGCCFPLTATSVAAVSSQPHRAAFPSQPHRLLLSLHSDIGCHCPLTATPVAIIPSQPHRLLLSPRSHIGCYIPSQPHRLLLSPHN